jgi:hypothetical protein
MKILNRHISSLQLLFFVIYVTLSSVMIFTPIIITGSVHITKKFIIDEDVTEVILLSILFALSLLIFNLYRKEASKQAELIDNIKTDKKKADEKLFDSMDYIGKVNVQIEEIKSIFETTNAYPETMNEFKRTVRFLGDRVLGIVNTNWVLFRIVNSDTHRTVYECFETRQGFVCRYPHVSNKMMVEKRSISPFTAVVSNPHNFNFLVFCAMPIDSINNDQQVFIQAIMNKITMLFIILNSSHDTLGNRIAQGNRFSTMTKAAQLLPTSRN